MDKSFHQAFADFLGVDVTSAKSLINKAKFSLNDYIHIANLLKDDISANMENLKEYLLDSDTWREIFIDYFKTKTVKEGYDQIREILETFNIKELRSIHSSLCETEAPEHFLMNDIRNSIMEQAVNKPIPPAELQKRIQAAKQVVNKPNKKVTVDIGGGKSIEGTVADLEPGKTPQDTTLAVKTKDNKVHIAKIGNVTQNS